MFKKVSKTDNSVAQLSPKPNVQRGVEQDQQWMIATKNGDRKAFENLFQKYKGPIMSYVNGIVNNKTLAEDLTQEVFLRVYRFRETYSAEARFSTWLWTIARNASIDHLRSIANQMDSKTEYEFVDNEVGNLTDPEKELIQKTSVLEIQDCLDRLPDTQKDVLVLHISSDLSYEDLATMTGTSLSAVKSLLFRGRDTLLKCLQSKRESK